MKKQCKLIKYRRGYILVSDDKPQKYDLVYFQKNTFSLTGKVARVSANESRYNIASGDLMYVVYGCQKIVAVSTQIELSSEQITEIRKKKGVCFIEMSEDGKEPLLINNKVIIS